MKVLKTTPIWHDLEFKKDNLVFDEKKVDKITLIQQFFVHKDRFRNVELQFVLKKNIECLKSGIIDNYIMLNERIYTHIEMGIPEEDWKLINQVVVKDRLTFKIVIEYVQNYKVKGYIVFSNSDIFFDETIRNVFKTSLIHSKCWYSLLRYEYYNKSLYGPNAHAQDSWIFHSNCKVKKLKLFNFILGILGCDNILPYELVKQNIYIYNSPKLIKTWHVQKQNKRDYTFNDRLPPPYLRLTPDL